MKLFKKRILIIGIRVLIYLHLSHKKLRDLYFYYKNLMCNGFYSNKLIYLFLRKRNNFVGFITPVVKKWLILMRSLVVVPAILVLQVSCD